jgi:hypothetical protein
MADTFRFGRMEAALGAVFGVAPAKMPAFHGRLQFLQVRGLPLRARGGRGVKIEYSRDQAMQFLLAIVLEQHGTDPKTCVWLIENWWKEIGPWLDKAIDAEALAEKEPNPIFMTVQLTLMSEMFGSRPADQVSRIGFLRRFDRRMKYDFQKGRWSRTEGITIPRENIEMALDGIAEVEPPYTDGVPWVVVIGLTKLLHAFDQALKSAIDDKGGPARSIAQGMRRQRKGAGTAGRRRARKGK